MIALITYGIYSDIVLAVHANLFQPHLANLVESFSVVGIVHHDNCIGVVIVGFSDAFESLLAGCVPDLHFDVVVANGDRSALVYVEVYLNLKSTPMVAM